MAFVLIVDDDPVYRHLHAHVLRGAGHTVVQAATLGEASAAVHAEQFDLVLADYVLPDGDGLDLLDELGSDPSARPRFVLVTGKSDAHELSDDRVVGVDAYLTKPASSSALRDCVTTLSSVG
jgi:two-component system, NtrC family, response regulator PilR